MVEFNTYYHPVYIDNFIFYQNNNDKFEEF